MWNSLLEGGETSQFVWSQKLAKCGVGFSKYLISTGRRAEFIPCGERYGCGWHVAPKQYVGRCPEGECPRREFSRSDLAMVTVDWSWMFKNLASAFELCGEPEVFVKMPVAMHLGWIAPAQSVRFPVFFCVPTAVYPVFPMIQRVAERAAGKLFVLVIASRDLLDVDSLGLLHSRKGEVVFLDEEVAIKSDGRMEAREAASRLVKFALATAGISSKPPIPKFPTPEGTQPQDLTIVEVDGVTIEVRASVRVGKSFHRACEQYTYESLGLTKRVRGNPVPTQNCSFLIAVLHHRRVFAESERGWETLRKYRSEIGALLEKLTGLKSSELFTVHRGYRGFEAAFKVECECGNETPLPKVPRRLNLEGRVARNSADE